MGAMLSAVANWFGAADRSRNFLLVGLQGAGKSAVLRRLWLGDAEWTSQTPVIGFSVETAAVGPGQVTVWPLGGMQRIRPLLIHYLEVCHGIMVCVDSSNRAQLATACAELAALFSETALKRECAFAILAHKADVPSAVSVSELEAALRCALDVAAARGFRWRLFATCALTGTSVLEAFDWLSSATDR